MDSWLKGRGHFADTILMRETKPRLMIPKSGRIEFEPIVESNAHENAKTESNWAKLGVPSSNVGSEISAFVESISPEAPPARLGIERRTRTRAKIDFRVHVRGGVGTLQAFEDVVHSVDVTKDGLLLSTARPGYFVGEPLQVTFPYWTTPTAINKPRRARVIRSALMRNMHYGLAVKFDQGNGALEDLPWIVTPFANQVRVLGVESDPRMAQAMIELLQQDGYNVVFVATAQQALDILRYETPDVILADAEGGEISGQDLCAIVKKNDRLQHIPVILLTDSALPSDYSASHKLGAVVCMMRPCQPGRLQRAVHLVAAPPTLRTVYSARFNMAPFVRTS
jgi:two-component system, chemotaxis family, response regulator PixH